jgi:tetratricopeptide (TPR) repeat protein
LIRNKAKKIESQMISKYEQALKLENEGRFLAAFPLFKECLNDRNYDYGDILFHCGWCTESTEIEDRQLALSYYKKAAKAAAHPVCKMNSSFRAGWILMHLNKNIDAIEWLKNAVQIGHSEGEFNSIYSEALYWCAVVLEAENRYLDAINLYRAVEGISDQLNPESRYREIISLIAIGNYNEAYSLCKTFSEPIPGGFSEERYAELKNLVKKEQNILEYSLNDELSFSN